MHHRDRGFTQQRLECYESRCPGRVQKKQKLSSALTADFCMNQKMQEGNYFKEYLTLSDCKMGVISMRNPSSRCCQCRNDGEIVCFVSGQPMSQRQPGLRQKSIAAAPLKLQVLSSRGLGGGLTEVRPRGLWSADTQDPASALMISNLSMSTL